MLSLPMFAAETASAVVLATIFTTAYVGLQSYSEPHFRTTDREVKAPPQTIDGCAIKPPIQIRPIFHFPYRDDYHRLP